jgi:hypothetical protein
VLWGWTAGVRYLTGVKLSLYSTAFRPVLRPIQLPIKEVQGASSAVLKRLEREADYSPPSSFEAKNCEDILPLPIRLHCVELNQLSTGTSRFTFINTIEE